jgi:hypothetical protein
MTHLAIASGPKTRAGRSGTMERWRKSCRAAAIDGDACRIRIQQDPAAGKFVAYRLAKKLSGYTAAPAVPDNGPLNKSEQKRRGKTQSLESPGAQC